MLILNAHLVNHRLAEGFSENRERKCNAFYLKIQIYNI